MPVSYKLVSLVLLAFAGVFVLFFFMAKHNPVISDTNPFAADPYDAVGSAGIQLAMFTALVGLVRVFRPYPIKERAKRQKLFVIRGWIVSLLSIAVTLMADVVALVRYLSAWIDQPGSKLLLFGIAAMVIVASLLCWFIFRLARDAGLPPQRGSRIGAVIIFLAGIAILLLYPAGWKENFPGAIFTAALGLALLFVMTWAASTGALLETGDQCEDFVDDIIAMYRPLQSHLASAKSGADQIEKREIPLWLRHGVGWLNPRRHRWSFVIFVTLAVSISFTADQISGEGPPNGTAKLIGLATVLISLECFAVILGYILFARYLCIFRETTSKT